MLSTEKKITVIIPVHNGEHILKQCLDSIFDVNYSNFNVIVVNDCSSDRTASIANKYPCKIVNLTEQKGPGFARDRGVSLADGEIIAFLDSDCIVPKDWLCKINTRLTPGLVGIGGKYIHPKDSSIITKLFMTYWDPKNIFYTKSIELVSFSGENCAFWRSVLMRERPKRELVYCDGIAGGEDTIMCCELSRYGKLVYDPDIYVIHKKKCSFLTIIKKTIRMGYTGAIASSIFGNLLIRESYRTYKFIIFLFSASLLLLTLLLPLMHLWPVYFFLLTIYLLLQLPIMVLANRQLSLHVNVIFFPVVIFVADMLHLLGCIKRVWSVFKETIKRSQNCTITCGF